MSLPHHQSERGIGVRARERPHRGRAPNFGQDLSLADQCSSLNLRETLVVIDIIAPTNPFEKRACDAPWHKNSFYLSFLFPVRIELSCPWCHQCMDQAFLANLLKMMFYRLFSFPQHSCRVTVRGTFQTITETRGSILAVPCLSPNHLPIGFSRS